MTENIHVVTDAPEAKVPFYKNKQILKTAVVAVTGVAAVGLIIAKFVQAEDQTEEVVVVVDETPQN